TNKLIDYYRRSGRHPEASLDEIQDKPDSADSATTQVMRSEESQKVRLIIQGLPARYQQVLQLKFFAELSNEELAAALKISVNNAGVLLHRALKKFKESYEII
ncbi:MAG: sigma-70 family RNA polymerase sigma factor, partial [Candidatus Komeilibacteria bacterium]|nr:sigma-70 family RNA polymerase sigma factor [Candidatus Komeilibacteria bacterium]